MRDESMVNAGVVKDANSRPINILLAEDNEADVKITLRAFDKARLRNNIYIVNDGEEALDFIYHRGKYQDDKKFFRPGLILLDIKMPRLGGFEVLERVKSDAEYSFIPVVMLTSSEDDEDIVKSYRKGACGYMPKPVTFEEFLNVINGFNFYWHIVNELPEGNGI